MVVVVGGGRPVTTHGSMSRRARRTHSRTTARADRETKKEKGRRGERERERFRGVIHARVQTPRRIHGSFARLALPLSLYPPIRLPLSLSLTLARAPFPFLSPSLFLPRFLSVLRSLDNVVLRRRLQSRIRTLDPCTCERKSTTKVLRRRRIRTKYSGVGATYGTQ